MGKLSHWSLIAGLAMGLTTAVHAQEMVVARDTKPTLTVSGTGEIAAPPDRATVRLGAEAQAENASEAQAQVNDIVQKALQGVKAVGIEERKIQTSGISLFPVYAQQEYKPNTPQVVPRTVLLAR